MSTQTTKLDLKKTAAAAALSLAGEDALGLDAGAMEAFTAAKHDRLDFQDWKIMFNNELTNNATLAKQPAASAIATGKVKPANIPANSGSN
jgi:hypothetical protein